MFGHEYGRTLESRGELSGLSRSVNIVGRKTKDSGSWNLIGLKHVGSYLTGSAEE